jgi:hypothetical protein
MMVCLAVGCSLGQSCACLSVLLLRTALEPIRHVLLGAGSARLDRQLLAGCWRQLQAAAAGQLCDA